MKFVERRTREIGRYMTCIDRKSRMYSGLDRADPAKKENRCRRRHTTEGNERRVCIVLFLSISVALLMAWTFQKRSGPQQFTMCRSLHAEALHAGNCK